MRTKGRCYRTGPTVCADGDCAQSKSGRKWETIYWEGKPTRVAPRHARGNTHQQKMKPPSSAALHFAAIKPCQPAFPPKNHSAEFSDEGFRRASQKQPEAVPPFAYGH